MDIHSVDISTIASLPAADVFCRLQTQPQGLAPDEAAARLHQAGPNTIPVVKGVPLYRKLLANFTHLMALLLWVGGIIAFVAGMPELGWAVWAVNVINGAFSFWQEFKAERATEALRNLLPAYATVLRGGMEQRILAAELVPGDVMLLAEGDHISADGRLVQAAELRVDQSTLSGESNPVHKRAEPAASANLSRPELPNLVFAGTNVASGTGRAVVFSTGMATEFGKIAHLTQSLGVDLSPLQQETKVVTKVVTLVAVLVGLIFFAVAVTLGVMNLGEGFIFALGMIVAFVPEGLLPTVTLALALGVQRMAKRHALVKRLSAVETLGCTSVICTDKTGTLTQNEMTVRSLWVDGKCYRVTGAGYAPTGAILTDDGDSPGRPCTAHDDPALGTLLLAAALCNNTHLLPPDAAMPGWHMLGDPTEAALLTVACKGGMDIQDLQRTYPRLRELPFESRRKRMSTINRMDGEAAVFVKGAPDVTLMRCTHIRTRGDVKPLEDAQRRAILETNNRFAAEGLRVLAVATRPWHDPSSPVTPETVECELTFLGLMAMLDPPRPEVSDAVNRCHAAGIRIIMITGDYGLTAESIARRIGIVRTPLPRIVTGAELDGMDEAALLTALENEVIFARVAPEHKLRVVSTLQRAGHVVAVTGDGVNDAPALKKADIGVAMGMSGTDVAKEAADIILTDDNFASIVNAVEEGRAVFANIKKFTCYIFTSNTPEALPVILFALSGARIPLALTVMQILAVDLGTDLAPALALGTERAEPGIMERPPRRLSEHVITRDLLVRAYVWLGPAQALIAMAAFYFQYWQNGYAGQWLDLPATGWIYASATAMTLAAVVTTQIGNLFAQRTTRTSIVRVGFFSNRLAWIGIGSEIVLIFLLVYVPLLQRIFGTAPFAFSNWLFLFAWTPALLVIDEARKALLRARSGHR